jgi:hypothetical protein
MRNTLGHRPVMRYGRVMYDAYRHGPLGSFISSSPEIFLQVNGIALQELPDLQPLDLGLEDLVGHGQVATLAQRPACGMPTYAAGAWAWLRLRSLDSRQAGGVSTTRRSSERLQKFDKIGFLPWCEIQLEQLIIVVDHRQEIRRTAVVEVWRMLPESS